MAGLDPATQWPRVCAAELGEGQRPTPVSVVRKVIKEGIKTGAVRKTEAQIATHLVLGLILQPATAHVYGEITGPLAPAPPKSPTRSPVC